MIWTLLALALAVILIVLGAAWAITWLFLAAVFLAVVLFLLMLTQIIGS